ncbi:DUF2142 domain-containing protein [Novilysobacter avium]|uniref:DUF2142 domain-containing protein n=1 Tax=Novilysobacter avium TaxID=2781023 RepID=A0A7S6UK31_9GAMM|nr:DUF2142 domain-containing protein [Lysobacter avium]QOW21675.1 DUF2142 domain-containing protein [Lysobacter avium]
MTGSDLRATLSSPVGALALLLVLACLAAYAGHRGKTVVTLGVASQSPGHLQVFHDGRANFTERHSRLHDIGPVDQTVAMALPGRGAMWLRIDPPSGTTTRLCHVQVSGVDTPAGYELSRASEVSIREEAGCLHVQAGSDAADPQFVIHFRGRSASSIAAAQRWWWLALAGWGLAGLMAVRLVHLSGPWMQAWLPGWMRGEDLDKQIHWIFVVIMLGFGAAYIVVTPPGAVPDEEAHLAKIVRISQGVPLGDSGDRPMPDPRMMYGPFSDYLINKEAFTRDQLVAQMAKPLVCEPGPARLARGANGYAPHHYLLPTLVYLAGCKADASFGWFLYLSRALNLLLATALIAFGLAHAGRGKWGLFLVALLPMSIFQMGSISADSLVMSLSLGWLGVVSGIAGGSLSPRRAAPALWGLSLAIAFLKPGTAWVLVCLLFCKPAYDAARMSFTVALAKHLALPWVIHLAWTLVAAGNVAVAKGVDAAANLESLMSHPAGALGTLLATVQHKGVDLASTMVGVLGWLDVSLSSWVYPLAGLLGLAALFANGSSVQQLQRHVLALALVAIVGSMMVIALPLLISWTPGDSPVIRGLQGRYFTVTAAFALVWCSFRSAPPIRAVLVTAILVGVMAINVDAIQRLHEAYFLIGRR